MKKTIILAIAFVLGTTNLVASVYTSNFLFPLTQSNTSEKKTSINNEALKKDVIISYSVAQQKVADLNNLKHQKKLKLSEAIRNYNEIAPSIIGKE